MAHGLAEPDEAQAEVESRRQQLEAVEAQGGIERVLALRRGRHALDGDVTAALEVARAAREGW